MNLKAKLQNLNNNPYWIGLKLCLLIFIMSFVSTLFVGGFVCILIIAPIMSHQHLTTAAFYVQMLGGFLIFIPVVGVISVCLWKSKRCYNMFGQYIGDA